MNVQTYDCKISLGEEKSGTRSSDGGTWTKIQLIASVGAVEGGDILDLMVDDAKINIFSPNLERMLPAMTAASEESSVPTYFVTLFSVNPYKIGSSTEMRAFRVPIPCSWVRGNEERAIILAGKLCGKAFRLNEEDAIDAFKSKLEEEKAIELNTIENQHSNAI
jgi:hypothetical protein